MNSASFLEFFDFNENLSHAFFDVAKELRLDSLPLKMLALTPENEAVVSDDA